MPLNFIISALLVTSLDVLADTVVEYLKAEHFVNKTSEVRCVA